MTHTLAKKPGRWRALWLLLVGLTLAVQGCGGPSAPLTGDWDPGQQSHYPGGIGGSGVTLTAENGLGGTGRHPGERGMGGTGHHGREGGIGGTGMVATRERGIGGTGMVAGATSARERGMGGTGIIGTITGFGSVWVNGLHVHYDHTTTVQEDGVQVTDDRLKLGQFVMIHARDQQGELWANDMEIHHEVVGPVTRVESANDRLIILGQQVDMSSLRDGNESAAPKVTQGQWLAVSGLRHPSGTIIASRLEPVEPNSPVLVRGPVARVQGDRIAMGTLSAHVGTDEQRPTADLQGQRITLRGNMADGGLRVESWRPMPTHPFGDRVSRYVVEGYRGPDASGRHALHTGPVALPPPKQPQQQLPEGRVLLEISVDGAAGGIIRDIHPWTPPPPGSSGSGTPQPMIPAPSSSGMVPGNDAQPPQSPGIMEVRPEENRPHGSSGQIVPQRPDFPNHPPPRMERPHPFREGGRFMTPTPQHEGPPPIDPPDPIITPEPPVEPPPPIGHPQPPPEPPFPIHDPMPPPPHGRP